MFHPFIEYSGMLGDPADPAVQNLEALPPAALPRAPLVPERSDFLEGDAPGRGQGLETGTKDWKQGRS